MTFISLYGIKQENILAFGDEDSDMEMIEPRNASFVTSYWRIEKHPQMRLLHSRTFENGLAKYLQSFFNIRMWKRA